MNPRSIASLPLTRWKQLRSETADLDAARNAMADIRRTTDPTAVSNRLRHKRIRCLTALATAITGAMMWSGYAIHHSLPGNGPGDPVSWDGPAVALWASALVISCVFGVDAAIRWGIGHLWRIATVETIVFTSVATLIVAPLAVHGDWYNAAIDVTPTLIAAAAAVGAWGISMTFHALLTELDSYTGRISADNSDQTIR